MMEGFNLNYLVRRKVNPKNKTHEANRKWTKAHASAIAKKIQTRSKTSALYLVRELFPS